MIALVLAALHRTLSIDTKALFEVLRPRRPRRGFRWSARAIAAAATAIALVLADGSTLAISQSWVKRSAQGAVSTYGLALGSPIPIAGEAATSPAFTNHVLDASTDAWEVIFQVPAGLGNITITKVLFRYGARALTPPTYRISLQGVDSNGLPDGVIKGGGSPAQNDFTPPADTTWDGLTKERTLDNPYTAAPGEKLALVIKYQSGTINGTNNSSFTTILDMQPGDQTFPKVYANNAGTRTAATAGYAVFGYASSTRWFGFPVQSTAATSFDSNTNPDERGLVFSLPASLGLRTVIGCRTLFGSPGATGGSMTMNLRKASDASVVHDTSLDQDLEATPTSSHRPGTFFFDDDPMTALDYETKYYATFAPGSASSDMSIRTISVADQAHMSAFPFGDAWGEVTLNNGGSAVETFTTRPLMDLIFAESVGAPVIRRPTYVR